MTLGRPLRAAAAALAALTAAATLAATTSAAPAATAGTSPESDRRVVYAQIEGTGSTWAQLLLRQWIADVSSSGMSVVYTSGGSALGRRDFAKQKVDFAVSDVPYSGTDETGSPDTSEGRRLAYVPLVGGALSFTYHLRAEGKKVRDLRLSPRTLARIFTGDVTNWHDPAITRDNNGVALRRQPITPVVRSDGSATTTVLTTYFAHRFPKLWGDYYEPGGATAYFPRTGRMVARAGSDQLTDSVASRDGAGSIGYVEHAYPFERGLPVADVGNEGGYFVAPTPNNVALALREARVVASGRLAGTLRLGPVFGADDPRAYPFSYAGYVLVPTGAQDQRMTTAKRQTLADFLSYSLCTGQTKAGAYGYAPVPLNLVRAGFAAVRQLKEADSGVDLAGRGIRWCDNPTFDGKHPKRDVLDRMTPMPKPCQRVGHGPCGAPVTSRERP